MQPIQEIVNETAYRSNRFDAYFEGAKIGILDIETTGLSPEYCCVILGGLTVPEESRLRVRQYFAPSQREEKELLQDYCRDLSTFDLVVTYNGNHFDLPFLKKRLARHKLPPLPAFTSSLDLYRCCRYYSPLPEILPNLKQKTVEWYLGLCGDRTDEIDGGESVGLYNKFCRSGDPSLRQKILLHNRDDLVQLSQAMKILDRLDLHRILFHEGFPVIAGKKRAGIKSIRLTDQSLTAKGFTDCWNTDYYAFEPGYQLSHSAAGQTFSLEVPLQKKQGCRFADLEKLPFSCGGLTMLNGYASGYLIVSEEDRIWHCEANSLVKLIIYEIMKGNQ